MTTVTQIRVEDLVEQVGSLPQVAAKVVTMAADPDCDIAKMAKIIASDNAMTLRFMAMANSAYFSYGSEVKSLQTALVRLGLIQVRNLALLMGVHDMEPADGATSALDGNRFWRYCLATASCAQAIQWIRSPVRGDENAWLAGILHGIGITALQQKAPEEFGEAIALAQAEMIPLAAAERQVFDFHHGDLGASILQKWQMPQLFVDTVRAFPDPDQAGDILPEAAALVRTLRDAVFTVRAIGFTENGDGRPPPGIEELGARLELADPALDALAEKVDAQVVEFSGLIGLEAQAGSFTSALEAARSAVVHLGLVGIEDRQQRENLESQLSSAREIQQRLLPEERPQLDGFELAAVNHPSLHVSGDTYDFLTLKDGRTAFVIADVCGKGMAAALLASTVQASLRALSNVFADPGELLTAANAALFQSTDTSRFATLYLAAVAADGSGIQYASAGHNPPLLLRADGSAEWLEAAGAPLGMMPEMEYPVRDVPMAEGDLLVAYTDGITEAVDESDEEYGEAGLEATVRATLAGTPDEIADLILAAVRAHVVGLKATGRAAEVLNPSRSAEVLVDAGDDLTLVLLRKNARP